MHGDGAHALIDKADIHASSAWGEKLGAGDIQARADTYLYKAPEESWTDRAVGERCRLQGPVAQTLAAGRTRPHSCLASGRQW